MKWSYDLLKKKKKKRISKRRKSTLLKVRDAKSYFVKCERCFERFSHKKNKLVNKILLE